ncbi:hypothetical protein PR003_g5895 [Phytophthora rubi]|uniref:Uncharacterized protein n=1 Tax=Phytophthora rubi TaxID=129364 RepID=A0A6A4FI99_9STRA|nr:hypothetical protein PR003_g5895 [Phytophthora rubi]
MSEDQPVGPPAMTLEIAAFPHLTSIEWQALHRLAAVSGEVVVTSLLSSATPDQQRLAIQEFMDREFTEAKRRVSTPSHASKNNAVKMETSSYSGTGPDRLPLNRWLRLTSRSRRVTGVTRTIAKRKRNTLTTTDAWHLCCFLCK